MGGGITIKQWPHPEICIVCYMIKGHPGTRSHLFNNPDQPAPRLSSQSRPHLRQSSGPSLFGGSSQSRPHRRQSSGPSRFGGFRPSPSSYGHDRRPSERRHSGGSCYRDRSTSRSPHQCDYCTYVGSWYDCVEHQKNCSGNPRSRRTSSYDGRSDTVKCHCEYCRYVGRGCGKASYYDCVKHEKDCDYVRRRVYEHWVDAGAIGPDAPPGWMPWLGSWFNGSIDTSGPARGVSYNYNKDDFPITDDELHRELAYSMDRYWPTGSLLLRDYERLYRPGGRIDQLDAAKERS